MKTEFIKVKPKYSKSMPFKNIRKFELKIQKLIVSVPFSEIGYFRKMFYKPKHVALCQGGADGISFLQTLSGERCDC